MKPKSRLRGEHSTLSELAVEAVDVLARFPEVTGISPGYIQGGKSGTGTRRVKIGDDKGAIMLSVRHGNMLQEIRVFTKDGKKTMFALACGLRDRGIAIGFKRE